MPCWILPDKHTHWLLPSWLFHSLRPHASALFALDYCVHSSLGKQLPDKVETGGAGRMNALVGFSPLWVSNQVPSGEYPVDMTTSLIKLGTRVHRMCCVSPNNARPGCIVLCRWFRCDRACFPVCWHWEHAGRSQWKPSESSPFGSPMHSHSPLVSFLSPFHAKRLPDRVCVRFAYCQSTSASPPLGHG